MLTEPADVVNHRAHKLFDQVSHLTEKFEMDIAATNCQTGSGALPLEKIPSWALTLQAKDISSKTIGTKLRCNNPPIITYIKNDLVYFDLRTVADSEIDEIASVIQTME